MRRQAMMCLAAFLLWIIGMIPLTQAAQNPVVQLDKVYADESHCLIAPEIRSEDDNPISCYCRDAIVDARYVYSSYVRFDSPHYDQNLNGPFLNLEVMRIGLATKTLTEV